MVYLLAPFGIHGRSIISLARRLTRPENPEVRTVAA